MRMGILVILGLALVFACRSAGKSHIRSIQQRLHAMKATGCFGESRLLFERLPIVPGCFQVLLARFVNAAEVEMRKGIRLIARCIERAFEPANAAVGIALGEEVTTDVVVRISQRLIDANCFQTFLNRFVVAVLKTINPTEKRVRLGGWVGFDRALVKLYCLFVVFRQLRLLGLLEELLGFILRSRRSVVLVNVVFHQLFNCSPSSVFDPCPDA